MRINQWGKISRFGVLGTAGLIGHGLNYWGRKYLLRQKYLARRIHDYQMCLDLYDPGLSRDIAIRGTREEQLKYLIEREVHEGDVVLDIGANIGYYTIMLAKLVGCSGKVYAIEPEPKNFSLLNKNVELNDVGQIVETFNIAAAEKNGSGRLFISKRSNLHSFSAQLEQEEGGHGNSSGNFIVVATRDLTSFLHDKRPVNLIRMDIEGHEVEVIRGLESSIDGGSFSGKIVFECHFPRYNSDHCIREPLRMLFAHGYRARYLTSSDERSSKIREKGYKPIAIVRTNDSRFRGIYEDIGNGDVVRLVSETGGVRDVLLEKRLVL